MTPGLHECEHEARALYLTCMRDGRATHLVERTQRTVDAHRADRRNRAHPPLDKATHGH
jgi:hypothetical protein